MLRHHERRHNALGRTLLISLTLLLVPGSLSAQQQADGFPAPGRMEYSVIRNNECIGAEIVEFKADHDNYLVNTSADISLKVVFELITAYRFKHRSEEVWENGKLISVTSRTDDNGKRKILDVKREGDVLKVNYNGKLRELPGTSIPASFWHPETPLQTLFLDPVSGKARRVSINHVGEEPIKIGSQEITAQHYSMKGDIKRELWYGPDGTLLKYSFPAKDDSIIWVILRSANPKELVACK
jgi:Family of unknown function (DUF6134)